MSGLKKTVPIRVSHLLIHTALLLIALLVILFFEITGTYTVNRIENGTEIIAEAIQPLCIGAPYSRECREEIAKATNPALLRICKLVHHELGLDASACRLNAERASRELAGGVQSGATGPF